MTELRVYKHNVTKTKRELQRAGIGFSVAGWTKRTCILDVQPDKDGSIKRAITIAHAVGANVPTRRWLDAGYLLIVIVGVIGLAYNMIPSVHYASAGGFFLFSGIGKFGIMIGAGIASALIFWKDMGEMTRIALKQLPIQTWEGEGAFKSRKRRGKAFGWMPGCAWWFVLLFIIGTLVFAGYIYNGLGLLGWTVQP